jgi:hypothetical protein
MGLKYFLNKHFGDEGRLKITGHKDGLFAHVNNTVPTEIYTSRLKTLFKVGGIQLVGMALFVAFTEVIIVILMYRLGISDLSNIISRWISIPIIILIILLVMGPWLWLLYYGNKNNWTGGLKK